MPSATPADGVLRRLVIAGVFAGVVSASCSKATKLGATAAEDTHQLLATLTGWKVVNAGIPGDTAHNGKSRIQALLDEHRPVLVIIEIGGNDFLRRQAPTAVKEDIRQLIQSAQQGGAQVALVSVPELSLLAIMAGKPSDSPIYAELAEEQKVLLVPTVFSDTLARPELCADRIHPNARGYQHMAEGIHTRLQTLGLAR